MTAAPGPYEYQMVGTPGQFRSCHVYLIDKTGRKIAAVWGKREEIEDTAQLLAAAHDMLDALKEAREFIAEEMENREGTFDPGEPEHASYIQAGADALAKIDAALDLSGGKQ